MITLPRSVCVDLDQALNKEWLVGNGLGGYASSTVVGANTRRYHGLLVAALKPPVERTVLFSKVDEEVELDGRTYYLGCNEYPNGKIHPGGFVYIEEFQLRGGIPVTVFGVAGSVLHKTVWMEHGHNTTYVRYTYVEGPGECSMRLHPMCNFRDYHSTTRGALDWNFEVEALEGGCKVAAYDGAAPMWLSSVPAAEFTRTGVWYWNFVYRREVERGFDETEDLYVPGVLRVALQPGESFTLAASTEPPESTRRLVGDALEREQVRQIALLARAGVQSSAESEDLSIPGSTESAMAAHLVLAADTFIVARELEEAGRTVRVPTVLAGYHWFTDWGRDTMISLPGLTLPTGRAAEAGETLRAFARYVKGGLLPNNFPDAAGPPEYNTVDASLWMFHAVAALTEATGDPSVARGLYPVLSDMIAWHVRGTEHAIGVDPEDGLLRAGHEGLQLTWMDARSGDRVVTPRIGKPVEINALWYDALRTMEKLSASQGKPPALKGAETLDFKAMADRVRASFRKRFWYEPGGYLFDVVDGPDGDDASLRPNQVLAVSLRPDLLSKERARQVLAAVRQHLLTPYGLRTLSPQDPQYIGIYAGDRVERDAAYHQGTVWAWLLGPYFDAVRAVEGARAARAELKSILPALRAHMLDAGLGTISEIFDADPPHAPKGCISQAWSVAELLRLLWKPV
jgi:predicted glycogen debranching enzyme